MMVIVILGMLTSLTGGTPTTATPKQSYIVQANTTVLAAQLVERYGGIVTSRLEIIHAVGALLSDQGVAQLRLEKGIVAITPNGSVASSDNDDPGDKNKEKDKDKDKDKNKNKDIPSTDYPNVVGADLVWQSGVNGSGVTVAVLDTGLGNLTGLEKGADNKRP